MKYKSLIGDKDVFVSTKEPLVESEVSIRPDEIYIFGEDALKEALGLKLIEEVKPRELYVVTTKDGTVSVFYTPEEVVRIKTAYKGADFKRFVEITDED